MPSWRCCAGTRPTGFRACPVSARRPPRRYSRSTAPWRASWPPSTTPNRHCPRGCGPSCERPPTTSRPPARWCGWPPTRPSRCRRRPTPCRWSRPTRGVPRSWRPGSGSGHRSRGCRRRSTRCPRRDVTVLLGPAHLVSALVVLESHRDLTLGAVDADVAVEAAALFDRRILTVVALDVFDVLRAVAVGLVGEDLLHTDLRLTDVQLGGDEEAGRPEAQHQDDRHQDRGEHADHRADDRPRPLRAARGRLAIRSRVLTVLTGLTVLAVLTRLPVLTGLRVGAGLAVLSGLRAVLAGRGAVLVLLRVARGLRERLRRRVVLRGRLLVLPVFGGRVGGRMPGRLLPT